MKRKLILMCAAGVLVMTAIIGGTLAGFNAATDQKGVTDITVKALGIELMGTGSGNVQDVTVGKGLPGSEIEIDHSVRNEVEGGYTLYTRVTIDKKWTGEKAPELDAAKIHLYAGSGEDKVELLEGTTVNGWIVWYADDEQVIMYYTKPLEEGAVSQELVNIVGFDTDMDNAYTDAEVSLSFRADAVQTIAADASIPSEWGVYPTIAEDGTITSIEE